LRKRSFGHLCWSDFSILRAFAPWCEVIGDFIPIGKSHAGRPTRSVRWRPGQQPMGNAPARDQLAGEKIPEIASGYNVFYAYDHAQNRLYKENNIRGSRDTFSYETANKMANMKSVLGFHHAPSRSTSTGIRFLVLHGRLVKQSRNGAELSACVRAAAHPRLRGGTAPKPGCSERSIVAAISHLTSNMQNGIITPPVR